MMLKMLHPAMDLGMEGLKNIFNASKYNTYLAEASHQSRVFEINF